MNQKEDGCGTSVCINRNRFTCVLDQSSAEGNNPSQHPRHLLLLTMSLNSLSTFFYMRVSSAMATTLAGLTRNLTSQGHPLPVKTLILCCYLFPPGLLSSLPPTVLNSLVQPLKTPNLNSQGPYAQSFFEVHQVLSQ